MSNPRKWESIGSIFILIFIVLLIADTVCGHYAGIINKTMGIETSRVETGDGEAISYERTYTDEAELSAYLDDLGIRIEGEGMVLLKNENDALPLSDDEKVSLLFMGSTQFNYSASGSGGMDASTYPTLRAVMEEKYPVNDTLWTFYTEGEGAKTSRKTKGAVYGRNEVLENGVTVYQVREINWSEYTDAEKSSLEDYNTAIFTISRSSGEGKDVTAIGSDGYDGSYLSLTEDEISVLKAVTDLKKEGKIKKIIVLINTSAQLQCAFLDDEQFCEERGIDVDAALWVGNVGKSGIKAIPKVLSGEINPSGRLSDTLLNDNLTSPAMQEWIGNGWFSSSFTNSEELGLLDSQKNYAIYEEGIYVGYRYYETRYEDYVMGTGNAGTYNYKADVAYPFGYGLSYTDFKVDGITFAEGDDDTWVVKANVTNTGDVEGKHTVQVYLQKPYTDYDKENGVEKAAVELAGFAKTGILEPGASEEVSIVVEKYQMKSYDANGYGTYILDAGDYYLTVAEDAHKAANQILAAKGYTPDSTDKRMDAEAGIDETKLVWSNAEIDAETYAKSIYTGEDITNQFDFSDVNRYEGSGDNHVTYVSRSDWEGTMPTGQAALAITTDTMKFDISSNKGIVEDEGAQMPTYGADNGRTLAMMYGKAYDDEEWELLLDQMTFEDTAKLLSGNYQTVALESVSKPQTAEADGPTGDTYSITQNSFPCEGIWASTYNLDLIREIGEAYGEDAVATGHTGVYAPGVNIHRVPYGGRSAEYFSEDPYLSAMACVYEVQGLESRGVIAHVKHFAFNDQDTDRAGIGIWLNEQEAREIMLLPFEYSLSRGKAHAVMTAFSRIGCEWAGAASHLLRDVLLGEWSFEGFNITDMAQSNGAEFMTYQDGVMRGTDQFLKDGSVEEVAAYKNSPTFCQRMRDSAHRMLYAVCNNSVAMNGYSVDTKIIVMTAWWQTLLKVLMIVTGVVGFGSALLYIILTFVKKKKSA